MSDGCLSTCLEMVTAAPITLQRLILGPEEHTFKGVGLVGDRWLGSKRRRYLAIPEGVGNINRGQQCCRSTFGQIVDLVE